VRFVNIFLFLYHGHSICHVIVRYCFSSFTMTSWSSSSSPSPSFFSAVAHPSRYRGHWVRDGERRAQRISAYRVMWCSWD